mmetsp:Transcript_157943/g.383510  ORF Transcript_157943/g.383510 Transcript_157943/m.383510 type:complete len:219 (+) Transcript_157943:431-1087(+)
MTGPCLPKAAPILTCSTNFLGQGTGLQSMVGVPMCQPQALKSSQPSLSLFSAGVCEGMPAQLQAATPLLPQMADCCLERWVPGLPQMFAVLYWRLSKPGTAKSMWNLPSSQPKLHGGQRFFFMITTIQSLLAAVWVLTSRHCPQPPPPPLSAPQSLTSGPRMSETPSEAAPVIQIFSPYTLPPWWSGFMGAYCGGEMYLSLTQGFRYAASQPWPLQSQ